MAHLKSLENIDLTERVLLAINVCRASRLALQFEAQYKFGKLSQAYIYTFTSKQRR